MELTKYTHSSVRIEHDGHVLVFDPGNFAPEGEHAQLLDGTDYLLITHEHPDHFDADRVLPLIAEKPQLRIWAPQAVAEKILDTAPNAHVTVVSADSEFSVPGFDVQTFGGQHALIHPLIPTIANIGYLINGVVYHPGDSLVVPHGVKAPHVLVPVHAPWSKVQEVIDFVIAVGAQHAYPIHNGMINENGTGIIEGLITTFSNKYGTEYSHLNPGDTVKF